MAFDLGVLVAHSEFYSFGMDGGSKGGILLCDLSQYCIGLRAGMRFDMSIHAHFSTDELLARLIERHDGQPLWDKALTLEDGSTSVSPFVTLQERE